jgi:hypothetical protein
VEFQTLRPVERTGVASRLWVQPRRDRAGSSGLVHVIKSEVEG